MPKINIYVPDDMLEWLRANDIKYSQEFQTRIKQLQANGQYADPNERVERTVKRLRVRNGVVKIRGRQTPIDYYERDGEAFVVVVE